MSVSVKDPAVRNVRARDLLAMPQGNQMRSAESLTTQPSVTGGSRADFDADGEQSGVARCCCALKRQSRVAVKERMQPRQQTAHRVCSRTVAMVSSKL
jgi:hypothetical protein